MMTEEPFAPVMPLLDFSKLDDVIAAANNTRYGLAAYVFTNDLTIAWKMAEGLEAGIIGINDPVPATPQCPFGGMKESGLGRELGHEGLEAYLETKYVSLQAEGLMQSTRSVKPQARLRRRRTSVAEACTRLLATRQGRQAPLPCRRHRRHRAGARASPRRRRARGHQAHCRSQRADLRRQEGPRLGAAVPCYRIYEHEQIAKAYPGLIDAASLIGGIQIQSRASLGGNLCNASPAADSIPPLIALEAVCVIAGPEGTREVPVEKFCTAPGKTVLGPGEFLVSLKFPPPKPRSGASYLRFIPRNEMDIAVVGAGVSVDLDDAKKQCTAARVALAAVAPTPLLVPTPAPRSWIRGQRGRIDKAAAGAGRGQADQRHARRRRLSPTPGRRPGQTCVAVGCRSEPKELAARTDCAKAPCSTTINGKETEFLCEPRQSLLEVLRDELRLTGTKEGCNNGNCGACNVLLDGRLVNSCLVMGAEIQGRAVRPSKASPRRRGCIRCSRSSSNTRPCNAASARPAFSSRPRRCSIRIPSRPSTRCATTWPATCAAAPATTRSCAPSSTRPHAA